MNTTYEDFGYTIFRRLNGEVVRVVSRTVPITDQYKIGSIIYCVHNVVYDVDADELTIVVYPDSCR